MTHIECPNITSRGSLWAAPFVSPYPSAGHRYWKLGENDDALRGMRMSRCLCLPDAVDGRNPAPL